MVAQFIARSEKDWDNFKEFCWNKMEFPTKIEYKNYSGMRSISQNNLVHQWFGQMAQHFTAKGYEMDQEEAKELMKHLFLGYEDRKINNTVIKGQLRRTRDLDKGEMSHFMDQIDAWAVDKGLYLIKPADSEYMRLKEAQER